MALSEWAVPVSGDSWRKRRGELLPRPTPQGCRVTSAPGIQPGEGGPRTEARQTEGHGERASGAATTLEDLSLRAHWAFGT